jgi:tetratricopeptide (TPR) repeat protein
VSPRPLPQPVRISTVALLLAALVLVGAIAPLHWATLSGAGLGVTERAMFLPPPAALRAASLGFQNVAADVIWLLTIQYIGDHILTDQNLPELFRLIDTVVTLDPHFVEAYTLGALFMNYSGGNVPGAIALLERGVRANPTRWELPHDLARTYYLDLKDYPKALHWFEITDRLPGRPGYVPRFIARLYAKTGERETALEWWQAIRDSAASAWVREIAEREIAKLERQAPPSPQGKAPIGEDRR